MLKQFFRELFCRHKEWTKGRFYPEQQGHVFTCKFCGKQKMFKAGNSPPMGIMKSGKV